MPKPGQPQGRPGFVAFQGQPMNPLDDLSDRALARRTATLLLLAAAAAALTAALRRHTTP